MPRVIKVKTNRFGAGRQLDTVIVEAISFFFFFSDRDFKIMRTLR